MDTRALDIQEASSSDEKNEIEEEVKDSACCAVARPFRPLLYLMPASYAAIKAINTGSDLKKIFPPPVVYVAAIAELASTIGLTGEPTQQTLNETCDAIKRRALPKDWPRLTRGKEVLAISLCILPAIFAPISEGIQAYSTINSLPDTYKFDQHVNLIAWSGFSVFTASLAGSTVALIESVGMYNVFRNYLAPTNTYKHPFSKILGVPLGVLDSLQVSLNGYFAIKSVLDVNSLTGKILLGIPSMANAIPFFCFSGIYTIDAINAFIEEKNRFRPKKIIAMTSSTLIGIYLGGVKIFPNKIFYKNSYADFGLNPNDVPWQVFEALAWAMFAQNLIQITATLYSPTYRQVDRIAKKIQQGYSYIRDTCCSSNEDDAHDDKQPLLKEELDDLPNETLVDLSSETVIQFEAENDTIQLIKEELFESEPEIEKNVKLSTNTNTLFARTNSAPKDDSEPEERCTKTDWCVLF